MNEQIASILNKTIQENDGSIEWTTDFIEHFARNVVKECIQINVNTAKTMRDNGLHDTCSPHQYNFEIATAFDMVVIKKHDDEVS